MCREYFGNTVSKIGGVDIGLLSRDITAAHKEAFSEDFNTESPLPFIGQYAFRKDGESHAWNPETIATLQLATRLGSYKSSKSSHRWSTISPSPYSSAIFLISKRDAHIA